MSKRLTDRERLFHKLQQMTDIEVEDVLDYLSLLERNKNQQAERGVMGTMKDQRTFQTNQSSDDELLALLSSAYENRRACQVFEWEAARRKSEIKIGSGAR